MASPAVVGTPAETAISTASTSHVVNLPSGTAGNMFVAIMSKGSQGTTPSVNALTGWNELLDEAIVLGLYIAVKECDGTEDATTTFTLSSATRGAWIVYEVSGQEVFATQAPQVGTTATGSSTTPNPPSVSVSGGSKDVLTIACFGRSGEEADDDTWVTAAPSGFGGLLQKACGTAGTNLGGMIATAHLQETTATADPATFTCATGAWRSQTVVIHPAPPPPTQTSVARISLASGGTPVTATDHSIKVRARTTAGAGTIRAALYEGANNRSGDLESSALTTSLADYTLAIGDSEAANITDYSDLEIRLWGYAAGGGAIVFEVDQLWLETPEAGAITYEKVGTLSASVVLDGADVREAIESGALVVGGRLAALDAFSPARTGSLVGRAALAGSRLREHSRAASVLASARVSGVQVEEAAAVQKVGSLVALARSAGADVREAVETGSLVADTTLAGADVREAVEAGTLSPDTTLAGGGAHENAGAGTLSPLTTLSGLDVSTFAEVGTLMVFSVVSGVGQKSGTITKAGFLAASGAVSGDQQFTVSRAGSLVVDTTVAGGRIREKAAKAGDLVSGSRLLGADSYTATETGTLVAGTVLEGGGTYTASRSGDLVAQAQLAGIGSTVEPALSGGDLTKTSTGGSRTRVNAGAASSSIVSDSGRTEVTV